MSDRFFPNNLPPFTAGAETTLEDEEEEATSSQTPTQHSLTSLLSLPYQTLTSKLQATALHFKQSVVSETWGSGVNRVKDYTLYTGVLGTAYLVFKSYQVSKNVDDLNLCLKIVKACDSASANSSRVTFICGRAGVCALGAVIAKHAGDERLLDYYLRQFKEIELPCDLPYELLYGRTGYLWACSFLNKHVGKDTIPTTYMRPIVDEVITTGRKLAHKGRCPLMYEWHGKKYWGAAHGLAGIMNVLMDMELKPDEVEDIKGTLRYMIKNRFSSGNYPSSEGSESDRLVHWCHGAPGVTLTLVKAAEVFGDREFLQAAEDAGEVVWKRGLLKRVGICHGISGNTYVFLSLYRLTGNKEYLYRAKGFSCFLLDRAQELIGQGKMHGGDRPYSLFEGLGGMTYTFVDMIDPQVARFPGYEL
ncbi:lanC-like protein GCR2 [Medicago truncatula]|uniref:G protein coupled receptor n=1 Tax=Medicago truncatula TaxID=3880 RepID=A0A072VKU4_MEDTR|nr:lanC-like protein GCR2 [Medicago truncatula]KEH38770.1 G protein coupled receptor [Medicago truncatula]